MSSKMMSVSCLASEMSFRHGGITNKYACVSTLVSGHVYMEYSLHLNPFARVSSNVSDFNFDC